METTGRLTTGMSPAPSGLTEGKGCTGKINHIRKRVGPILHIWEPVFQSHIFFVYAKSYRDALRIIAKYFQANDESTKNVEGCFFTVEVRLSKRKRVVDEVGIIWCNNKRPDDMAHEVRHAVDWIVKTAGVEDDETPAYLSGFLTREILGLD